MLILREGSAGSKPSLTRSQAVCGKKVGDPGTRAVCHPPTRYQTEATCTGQPTEPGWRRNNSLSFLLHTRLENSDKQECWLLNTVCVFFSPSLQARDVKILTLTLSHSAAQVLDLCGRESTLLWSPHHNVRVDVACHVTSRALFWACDSRAQMCTVLHHSSCRSCFPQYCLCCPFLRPN